MTDPKTRVRPAIFGLAIFLMLPLAACGKKGPLEPAPGSPDAAKAEEMRSRQAAEQQNIAPAVGGRRPRRPPPVTPPKGEPFFLDFLL